MIDDSMLENIFSTMAEALQETSFLFSDPVYDEVELNGDEQYYKVKLTFSGDPSGEFQLSAPKAILFQLSENLLGITEEDPQSLPMGINALKETLNIFMGNFLTREFGLTKVFDLGIPELVDDKAVPNPTNGYWMSIDDYFIQIVYTSI